MKTETIKKIKKQLLKEKKEIKKALANIGKKDKRNEDNYVTNFPDFGREESENAMEVAAYGDNLALEEELEKNLLRINQALEKIKRGTYGICKKCGQKINEAYLLISPLLDLCQKCKNKPK